MKKILIAAAAFLLASCATKVQNLPLENTQWKLVSLYGDTNPAFEKGDSFTFTLDAGSITGKGSVNRFFGGYEYSDTKGLEIGDLGMTRMMGPNVDLEDSFVQMFDKVDGCTVKGDVLTLTGEGKPLATFKVWNPDTDAKPEVQPALGTPIMTVEEALQKQAAAENTEE